METGTIKFFNVEKGYGFIAREDGDDLFFHHSALDKMSDYPQGTNPVEGDVVTFSIEAGKDGRPSAVEVRKAGAEEMAAA